MEISAVLLVTLTFGCAASFVGRGGAPAQSRAALELRIGPQIGVASDAQFELTLKSTSKQRLWANGRMALDGKETPAGLSEVWLEIVGPAGQVLFDCKVNRGFVDKRHYVILEPGGAVVGKGELRCFELEAGVSYTARAHYRDRNSNVPSAPAGVVHLSEELVSDWARFDVLGK